MSENHHIKEFLNSGKLEQYLVGAGGDLSSEIERMIQEHKEVREAYEQAQKDLAHYGASIAAEPPSELRDLIVAGDRKVVSFSGDQNRKEQTGPVQRKSVTSTNWFAIAATITALICLGGLWYTNDQNQQLREELSSIRNKTYDLQKTIVDSKKRSDELTLELERATNFLTDKYILKDQYSAVQAVIFHSKQDNFASIRVKHLNPLDKEHDYQLWADVEGEMVSLGVIDKTDDVKNLDPNILFNAESINLTVEKAGGSDHATVENLVASVAMVSRP